MCCTPEVLRECGRERARVCCCREAHVSKVRATAKHEFYEFLPPAIFFFVSFHIIVLERALMGREYGIRLSAVAGATIAALLVAKVVLCR